MTSGGPEIIAGRYRVLGELGRGGMGVVYRVQHVRTGARAALKLMLGAKATEADVERFRREAKISARIGSDNVVKILDADVAPGRANAPYCVMELLDGVDLDQHVGRTGKLTPEDTLRILQQVARALDRAHDVGVIHRDLKPQNLFLHRDERGEVVKVLDFGISKITDIESSMAEAALTKTGMVLGTPLYMAPEQARSKQDQINRTTDVWAFGLIAHHLLTADTYWRASSIAELMAQILVEPFEPPSSRWPWLTPAFDAWFFRCLSREQENRFPAAGIAWMALGDALKGEAPPSRVVISAPGSEGASLAATMGALPPHAALTPSPTSVTASGIPKTSRWPIVAAGLALFVAVGGGVGAWRLSVARERTRPSGPSVPESPSASVEATTSASGAPAAPSSSVASSASAPSAEMAQKPPSPSGPGRKPTSLVPPKAPAEPAGAPTPPATAPPAAPTKPAKAPRADPSTI